MNAERLEIARRLVACKGWVWLPGMLATYVTGTCDPRRVLAVSDHLVGINGTGLLIEEGASHGWLRPVRVVYPADHIPDLDDDLTRLGVLAVVRRAWGDPNACVRFVDRHPIESVWRYQGKYTCIAETEEMAILLALEAAL